MFTSQQTVNGITQFELYMGYLPTAAAAEKLRRQLLAHFPDATVVDFASRKKQTIEVVAEQAAETPAIQAFAPGVSPEIEQQAASLMKQAKAAMDAGNYEQAVNLLNQLLFLPPNAQSQEGQELIGLARERNGELAKAKAEYELYLKLFPDGDGCNPRQAAPGCSGRQAASRAGRPGCGCESGRRDSGWSRPSTAVCRSTFTAASRKSRRRSARPPRSINPPFPALTNPCW